MQEIEVTADSTTSCDRAFSSIDLVGQCLLDTKKVEAFRSIMQRIICPEHTVLDLGTGSGILACLAAAAGARNVVAVELDPYVAGVARRNVENNGYGGIIDVRLADARNCSFTGEHFDVVFAEMLTAGMVDEYQVQAINNLHRQKVVCPSTVFLPARQDIFVTLSQVDYNFHGLRMEMVIHAWGLLPKIKVADLSAATLAKSVSFSEVTSEECCVNVDMKIIRDGTLNALWLSSRAYVDDRTFLEDTISVNPPVAIPLPGRRVHEGQQLHLHLQYLHGRGFENLTATVE